MHLESGKRGAWISFEVLRLREDGSHYRKPVHQIFHLQKYRSAATKHEKDPSKQKDLWKVSHWIMYDESMVRHHSFPYEVNNVIATLGMHG